MFGFSLFLFLLQSVQFKLFLNISIQFLSYFLINFTFFFLSQVLKQFMFDRSNTNTVWRCFLFLRMHPLNDTLTSIKICLYPKRDDEHHRRFHMGVTPTGVTMILNNNSYKFSTVTMFLFRTTIQWSLMSPSQWCVVAEKTIPSPWEAFPWGTH